MASLKTMVRRFTFVMLMCLASALPVSAFFISALFPGYSALTFEEEGAVLILLPLVVGFLFGCILNDLEIKTVAFGTIAITIFSSIFIAIFIVSPILAGVAAATLATNPNELLEIFVAQRVLLFVVVSFPVLLLGAVMGAALSERLFPSEELRREIEKLREETREWHRILESKVRAQAPSEWGKAAEEGEVKPGKDESR